jgi:hypothetical protein
MSRRRWCRSAGSGVSLRSEGPASVCGAKDPSIWYRGCRWGPRPADHTPSRSWRLPDLFFPYGISDGRDRLGTRRPPPAGCALRTVLSHRAPRGRRWPCGATPSITSASDGLIRSGQLVIPIHGLSPCTARPRGAERRSVGTEFEHRQVRRRRRGAPGGGVRLRGGLAPPLRARSVVRSTT